MKFLLVGINSKYSHTNLAIRLLKKYACSEEVEMCEYTINEPKQQIIADIFKRNADALFFSCYIWNIEYIVSLCSDLRKITDAKIILGGPEVSFNTVEFMKKHSFADACILGEGEETFSELIKSKLNFKNIDGIAYRTDKIILNNPRTLIEDISTIPFPYTMEELRELDGRLIYYETSRGCPFNCSYCMSSTIKGVRYRELELVKEEMKLLIDSGCKIVKLTDRTFNADCERTYEIFKFLIDNTGNTTFHFEIAAHILNEKIFNLLEKAPKGLFQFEIGVQSTNEKTIHEINRKTDFDKISEAVKRIKKMGNIHIHLDLIAGLPFEDAETFKKSFNDVFSLYPDMLQLGFLKLLHGTKIRDDEKKHGYKYSDFPPYEVLENSYISYSKLCKLKEIEEVVDKFYNSGAFSHSLRFLLAKFTTAFDMFFKISEYFDKYRLFEKSHSQNGLFDIFAEFAKEQNIDEVFFDVLKLDYILAGNFRTPSWSLIPFNEKLNKKQFDLIEKNPEAFCGFSEMPMKEIIKKVHFEEFSYNLETLEKEYSVLVFEKFNGYKKLRKF